MKNKYASKYPVAVHIDNTSRVQVVTKNTNLAIYNILKNYKKNFGEGIIINTSFNKHGRTIVCTVNDAIFDFFDSNLDHLYIEGVRVDKV
jgi:carbamoyltransferase